ncbi:MAG: hypothetical protein ACI8UX_002289, partial [Psychromonas sp.]
HFPGGFISMYYSIKSYSNHQKNNAERESIASNLC